MPRPVSEVNWLFDCKNRLFGNPQRIPKKKPGTKPKPKKRTGPKKKTKEGEDDGSTGVNLNGDPKRKDPIELQLFGKPLNLFFLPFSYLFTPLLLPNFGLLS